VLLPVRGSCLAAQKITQTYQLGANEARAPKSVMVVSLSLGKRQKLFTQLLLLPNSLFKKSPYTAKKCMKWTPLNGSKSNIHGHVEAKTA
jgi:hypothetical protein